MRPPGIKILLLGGNGQLGKALKVTLPQLGQLVCAHPRHGDKADALTVDLMQVERIKGCLRWVQPDVVVNAAAYTSVDQAQTEPYVARAINAIAPTVLAGELQKTGGLLIHYSTDYVFDGRASRAYKPEDEPSPINVYGETKLAGELGIRQSGVDHLILRTSMVYDATSRNFATTMIELLKRGKTLKVVDDQITSPTWSKALALYTTSVLGTLVEDDRISLQSRGGTYHVAGTGHCSRYEFVKRLAARPTLGKSQVRPVPTKEFPTPAKRPPFSVLDCSHSHQTFGVSMDRWESHLDQVLDELRIY